MKLRNAVLAMIVVLPLLSYGSGVDSAISNEKTVFTLKGEGADILFKSLRHVSGPLGLYVSARVTDSTAHQRAGNYGGPYYHRFLAGEATELFEGVIPDDRRFSRYYYVISCFKPDLDLFESNFEKEKREIESEIPGKYSLVKPEFDESMRCRFFGQSFEPPTPDLVKIKNQEASNSLGRAFKAVGLKLDNDSFGFQAEGISIRCEELVTDRFFDCFLQE